MALLTRTLTEGRAPLRLFIDGTPVAAFDGDTILTAVLTRQNALRRTEFTGSPRAGFCLMGACQDCWVTLEDGRRLRACTTLAEDGMMIKTRS
jgi:predicted molibdopterin-dependent oxidoreductase YjgC